ncbi:FAD-linked oxidase [Paractinoplanes deccanensis]|uniref:FAD-linked oxidase n=1 Tax=Paractinoplanes deccanensis TaxID=113561 RepID=A0ABQ3XXY7_9ACTN|nr:FAD-binding oxidoreductase [Actinoplanes deccanensis]GID72595.1 FAD-linked oxidase [Actinoplanes deccanensis]
MGDKELRAAARIVHLPGDEGYDRARTTWSLSADLHPAAVVYPESTDEIGAVLRAAGETGLRVTPVGTGHNAHPLRDLSRTIMLRTERLNGVTIDAPARRARVQAGTTWMPVVEQAAGHGFSALHGSAPDVGVVGYTAGGGLSWYGRKYGLAANHVRAAELVLADGSWLRVDKDNDPDLFWAVRGGGGNFGVITALEFDLLDFATSYAGMLAWDLSKAPQVLQRWLEWTAEVPDEVTTAYRHLRFPPIPDLPEPFRGRDWVMIDGALLTGDEEAERLLAPLRELKPELDTFARVPSPVVSRIHMDPEEPTPGDGTAGLLDALPAEAAGKLLEADATNRLFSTELRHLGGALSRTRPDGGAVSSLDGQFLISVVGVVVNPEMQRAVVAESERMVASLSDYSRDRIYINFQQTQGDTSRAFAPAAWKRIEEIRRRVDPNKTLQANHEI